TRAPESPRRRELHLRRRAGRWGGNHRPRPDGHVQAANERQSGSPLRQRRAASRAARRAVHAARRGAAADRGRDGRSVAMTIAACLLCRGDRLTPIIDVGPQPIANRFLASPNDAEESYPIALRQCDRCGMLQIEKPVPARALIPPYDWITYSEPEAHLDGLVDVLMTLPRLGPGALAGGVSFKDDTTLARLERKGLRRWRLDMAEDLEVERVHGGLGVETIQDRLTPDRASKIAARRGRADVLLVRHILEHTSVPLDFIEALKRLTTPNGYIVVEVPDCSRALDGCDYTTIWEEHTLYYT